jgi:hypothetical protein
MPSDAFPGANAPKPKVEKKKGEAASPENKSFTQEEKTELLRKIDAWTDIFGGHMTASLAVGSKTFGASEKIEKLMKLRGYVEKGQKVIPPLNQDVEGEISKVINSQYQ